MFPPIAKLSDLVDAPLFNFAVPKGCVTKHLYLTSSMQPQGIQGYGNIRMVKDMN
jgi:hypothetical protein